jgi:hypothetical protein
MTSLPSWAVPGRKVVCIRGGFANRSSRGHRNNKQPKTKEIYTIRTTGASWIDGLPVLLLHELPNPDLSGIGDYGWACTRFRPVVTLEEDMLTFRSLLNTVPSNLTPETTI